MIPPGKLAGQAPNRDNEAPQAGIAGLRPHALRHTYGTRLRRGGADPAQVQYLLGHAWVNTAGRYFRAGAAEVAGMVEHVFGD
ncbi:site-specific integrase [Actinomadura napierensis]|uniref:Tyr recombinase domain-containing protein n=1 Tax=Actinomadura napierensis TaxID=267854 RepID=A0ABP5M4Y3_9ACTN